METHKQTRLVKTDRQIESAFIVFSCIISAGITIIIALIMENL